MNDWPPTFQIIVGQEWVSADLFFLFCSQTNKLFAMGTLNDEYPTHTATAEGVRGAESLERIKEVYGNGFQAGISPDFPHESPQIIRYFNGEAYLVFHLSIPFWKNYDEIVFRAEVNQNERYTHSWFSTNRYSYRPSWVNFD